MRRTKSSVIYDQTKNLRAAFNEFATNGFKGASISQIARLKLDMHQVIILSIGDEMGCFRELIMTMKFGLRTALVLTLSMGAMGATSQVQAEDCILDIDGDGVADGTAGAASNSGEDSNLACGANAAASGAAFATAIGADSSASGTGSTAVGNGADAAGDGGVAIGDLSQSAERAAIAVGPGANVVGEDAIGIGRAVTIDAPGAVAIGSDAEVRALTGTAIGAGAAVDGSDGVAIGVLAEAGANDALALGGNALASAEGATAVGDDAVASGVESFAGAENATASGDNAIAIGSDADDNDIGAQATASGAVAIGADSAAAFQRSVAIGANAQTSRDNQFALGTSANTLTVAGISSSASRAAQSGEVEFVTADANGNMATDGGVTQAQINQNSVAITDLTARFDNFDGSLASLNSAIALNREQIRDVNDGVAISMALAGSTWLQQNESFAVTANVGTYDGSNSVAFSAAGRLSNKASFNAAIGVADGSGRYGARAGVRFGW
ncbi:MAG: YadA-like family protein [Pseudomonadota bacterium]